MSMRIKMTQFYKIMSKFQQENLKASCQAGLKIQEKKSSIKDPKKKYKFMPSNIWKEETYKIIMSFVN